MNIGKILRTCLVVGALIAPGFVLSACDANKQDAPPPIVAEAPPQVQTEIIPVLADPQTQIWRPGYWVLSGANSFSWVPGKVIPRPSPTAVWAAAHWVPHDFGWSFEQGHWE